MAQSAGEIVNDAVRIGIAAIDSDLQPGFAVARRKHAPMRGVRLESIRQIEAGVGEANRIVHRVALNRRKRRAGSPGCIVREYSEARAGGAMDYRCREP